MQVIKVQDKKTEKAFFALPKLIYKGDPNYIIPLRKDLDEVFNPAKNKTFRQGTLQRFILLDDKQNCTGRIAAFTNKKYRNKGDDFSVGGIGFFECINDQASADMLLNKAKNWLQSAGMEAMDGPINFGERDRWWGMVTKGYMEPLYGMNYNPPYYVDLFKNYGFQPYFEQICLSYNAKEPMQQKIWDRHAGIDKNPDFSSAHANKKDLKKYAGDFATVYNKAWAGHGGLKQMEVRVVEKMFNKMKPVMDERLIWFAYYKKEPVALFVNIPDLNQWFKHLHGKFDLLHKLKFLWIKATKPNKKFTGLVFGVVPEWQGKGVDGYIIGESAKVIQQDYMPYTQYEMQWIGDFNPKMINVAESLGNVKRSRSLHTFRYLFDRNKPFTRHPVLL